MGKFYWKQIGKLVTRSHFWFVRGGESESRMLQRLRGQKREYRDQLRKARDRVYPLVDDLLSLQKP